LRDNAALAAAEDVTVVFYGALPQSQREIAEKAVAGTAKSSVTFHDGPAWNHHSFPPALASRDQFFLLLSANGGRVLDAMAAATQQALGDHRSLHLEIQ
jgi:hypothetical protein